MLDNNFNVKKKNEGNGMFIQEININKEFLAYTCSSKHVKEKQSCHVRCHQHNCKEKQIKIKHFSIFDHPSNYEKK